MVFLSSRRDARGPIHAASETEARRAGTRPTPERLLARLSRPRLLKRDTGRGHGRCRPFDGAPSAERPDLLPRRINQRFHEHIYEFRRAHFFISYLLADTPSKRRAHTKLAFSCCASRRQRHMGTRYHSSTTERERRDIWALLWRFKLQTISMVSAEISGLRSSKQALGGRIWGRIRIYFFTSTLC
jgi:hypothetical protein